MRRFNRFYTRQIGVLRKTYLDSPYSLGEARVLYEIAQRGAVTASEIGRALDLDAGYLSRVLRNFEKRGLIVRKASATDARQSHLTLTAARPQDVRAAGTPLAARAPAAMLGALDAAEQTRLIEAMATIESAARRRAATKRERRPRAATRLRAPKPGDFGWIVKRHAELYAQEYGWTEPFEGVCAQIVADFVNKFDRKRERCWIAEMDGENVGSIMLAKETDDASPASACCWSIRRRAGSASARGSTDECIRFARRAGYKKITLWTHSVLDRRAPHLSESGLQADAHRAAPKLGPRRW